MIVAVNDVSRSNSVYDFITSFIDVRQKFLQSNRKISLLSTALLKLSEAKATHRMGTTGNIWQFKSQLAEL